MTDKLTKKDHLIMSTLLDKLTIDMKITIENALTDALLSLNIRYNERDQYSRNNNLKIAGLLLLDDESHNNAIIALGKQLNVDILNSSTSSAYNVSTKSKLTSTIVCFTQNCVRNELYMARKDIKK